MTDVADSQRGERNLYRRVFRDLKRRTRKGDTNAGLQAIGLLHAGERAGHQMSGIVSADGANTVAESTLLQHQQTQSAANGSIPTAGAPSAPNPVTPNTVGAGPADGGDGGSPHPLSVPAGQPISSSRNGSSSALLSSTREPADNSAFTITEEERQAAGASSRSAAPGDGGGTINGQPTSEILGRRGAEVNPRGTIGGVATGVALGEEAPAPTPAVDDVKESSTPEIDKALADPEFLARLTGSLVGAADIQGKLDELDHVEASVPNLSDLPDYAQDELREAQEFRLYEQEKKEFGREEALDRVGKRAAKRSRKQRKAKEKDKGVAKLSPLREPRDRISKILNA